MSFAPTAEQAAIADAYLTGDDLCIEAGAGTGKTSTLKMLAAAGDPQPGVYLAFNRAIAEDAARAFPRHIECRTAHGFAFQAVGKRYAHRLRSPRMPAWKTAQTLGIRQSLGLTRDTAPLSPTQQARLALAAVGRFCRSADREIGPQHVAKVPGLDEPATHRALQQAILPWARRAWDDIQHVDGRLRFEHNHYLKLWGLTNPRLDVDVVMFDEAQDANPVISAIVDAQTDSQRVIVGDRCQAIYGWNGAVDAMARFAGKRLYLSQSWRFGQAVADEANKWLSILNADLRLTGNPNLASRVGLVPEPHAILCRSNAGVFNRAVDALQEGRRVAIVGGGDEIQRMAEAAARLMNSEPCDHPELLAFTRWAEVRDYAENDTSGSDLKVFVALIDKVGVDEILRVCNLLVDERADPQVVLSTAHKAKGREWHTVRVADDFREPRPDPVTGINPGISREDAMLAYVTVTRAQHVLDRSGLAWVDGWVPAGQYRRDPAERLAAVAAVAPEYVQPVDPRGEPVDGKVQQQAADVQLTLEEFLAPAITPAEPGVCDSAPEHHEYVGSWLLTQWCQRCQQPGESYQDCGCVLMPDRMVRAALVRQ